MLERHQQEYIEEITGRANDLIYTGDLDLIVAEMSGLEWNNYHTNLRVLCRAKTDGSRNRAIAEIRVLINKAAYRVAERAYQTEMNNRAKQIALARYYTNASRGFEGAMA
jgi:hypothetical protein